MKTPRQHRWETAIRCLEVALHPRTEDAEVLAAINGFRRTANGVPLGDICLALAAPGAAPARTPPADDAADRASAAEARVRALREQLAAAQRRAETAERALADVGAVYARQLDGLSRERAELRAALDRAQRPAVPSFRQVLSATMGREPPRPAATPVSRHPWTA